MRDTPGQIEDPAMKGAHQSLCAIAVRHELGSAMGALIEERAEDPVLASDHQDRRPRRLEDHTIPGLSEFAREGNQDRLLAEDLSALCFETERVGINRGVEFKDIVPEITLVLTPNQIHEATLDAAPLLLEIELRYLLHDA